MKIDRESFLEFFNDDKIPDWSCSSCKKGKVLFDSKKITKFETNSSKKQRAENPQNYYSRYYRFSGVIICNNPKCKEAHTIAGYLHYDDAMDAKIGPCEQACYTTEYISPPVHLFFIPEEIPMDIEEGLINSFKTFWIDKSACANSIRRVVELILNDQRIIRTKIERKSNKRRKISLHERIELFKVKNHSVARRFMAIKWIGNAGSHEGDIYVDDILDGFDLLKDSLEKLYTSHEKDMEQLAAAINRRKKPQGY